LIGRGADGFREVAAASPPAASDAKVAKRGLDPPSVETVPNIDFLDSTGVPRADVGLLLAELLREGWDAGLRGVELDPCATVECSVPDEDLLKLALGSETTPKEGGAVYSRGPVWETDLFA